MNSYMCSNALDFPVGHISSFICYVSRNSSLEFYGLLSWLARRFRPILSSSMVVNSELFEDHRVEGSFVSVSLSANDWTTEIKADNGASPLCLGSSSTVPPSLDMAQLIFIRRAIEWESVL
jgi:hypothetical protein